MSITFTDIFCGAGGSSTGLVAAGLELRLAANHWARAIETHAANHPGADHVCADVSNYDMRRLPATDVLWASPICTEISPAGGRRRTAKKQARGQLALGLEEFGPVPQAAFDRTRATAYDVLRATEVHRYKVVLIENVIEFAVDWELFDWWRQGMELLGYESRFISVSSAHIGGDGNAPAPQWRDRIYGWFSRRGIPVPDLRPRPQAWCVECGEDVRAVQSWRNPRGPRLGKYRQQYDYRCPNTRCRNALVEPYVRPAADIIDWSDPGVRIADRDQHGKRPLAPSTLARIRAGLQMLGERRMVVTVNHGGHDGRAFPADAGPLPARTVKIGEAVLTPCGGTWNTTPYTADQPLRTRTTREMEGVAFPPGAHQEGGAEGAFVVEYRNHATPSPVDRPVGTVTAQGNHHALVIPYRNAATKTAAEPLHTLSTRDSAGLALPAPVVEDCFYRMLQPREQLLAQRFPPGYIVHGNRGEQTMQAGNAVSANVAQWLGRHVAEVLG
ncbi:DNA cytosine methyltransferase [Streptomyces sp. DSM 44917]|uniref:DNA (cytosine-5-)-methyltransferase n=1 Tax=Streptomyces boetiae TaxID=3075541 RepID=A0ABU2L6T8_9ACTN|nr:DNA cytosine methyltransferase [Streptomyces sp. DSM 44917]MDT0307197.1 DNA cytosine methyltransferase [Streptomyces sp. DSM 44917]